MATAEPTPPDQSAQKRCYKCRLAKARSDFSKQAGNSDGLQAWCKGCMVLYKAAHRKQFSLRDAEYRAKNIEHTKATGLAYRVANRDRIKAKDAAWRAANRDNIKERNVAYNVAHRDEIGVQKAAYRAANHERFLAKDSAYAAGNRERVRARDRAHPEKQRARSAKRRAIKCAATTGDRKSYAKFVRWARETKSIPCYWCGKKTKLGKRQLDHVIPLSRGGSDAVENLCVSCPSCNQSKHAKLPEHFSRSGQSELRFA